jgi:transposase-like protein
VGRRTKRVGSQVSQGRGLKGVKLFILDKCIGLLEALGEFYPETV